jgi:hypothetical protein
MVAVRKHLGHARRVGINEVNAGVITENTVYIHDDNRPGAFSFRFPEKSTVGLHPIGTARPIA